MATPNITSFTENVPYLNMALIFIGLVIGAITMYTYDVHVKCTKCTECVLDYSASERSDTDDK
jgi:hypothetical protein